SLLIAEWQMGHDVISDFYANLRHGGDQNSFRFRSQSSLVGFREGDDKRGHIRIHARPTTRALREGAIGNNVEARPNSRGHNLLARWYAQVGCDLRSVRRRQDHSVVIARRRRKRWN